MGMDVKPTRPTRIVADGGRSSGHGSESAGLRPKSAGLRRMSACLRAGWILIGVVVIAGRSLCAEEPCKAFLDALRQAGYYESAVAYLDQMRSSPSAPADFRTQLDYHRGLTLGQAAVVERDTKEQERLLNASRDALQSFLQQHADHPRAPFARRRIGMLLVTWADVKVRRARRTSDPGQLKEAARLYDQGAEIFQTAQKELKQELATTRKDLDPMADKALIERRDAARQDYLDAQLQLGQILEGKADTVTEGSAEQKKLLADAANQYETVFTKYGNMFVGIRSRMYQARSLIKSGERGKALVILKDDVLASGSGDNRPLVRALKTQALLLAMDCWLAAEGDAEKRRGRLVEAIQVGTGWLNQAAANEEAEADWVELRLVVARAELEYAGMVKARNPRDKRIGEAHDAARKLARAAMRFPGPHREAARELLTSIPGSVVVTRQEKKPPPKDFTEANQRGQEALQTMQEAEIILSTVPERMEKETSPEVKAELTKALDEAKASVAESRQLAGEAFELAMSMVDSETPVEELTSVQYFLTYLYFADQRYFEAAVMGEFLARRHPDAPKASDGAQLAMVAYLRLYQENSGDDRQFEIEHLGATANYIVDTWPDKPAAVEAINTLIPLLLQKNQLDEAQSYVAKIPADSAERGLAEMRIGQALWYDYQVGRNEMLEWEAEREPPGTNAADWDAKIKGRSTELTKLREQTRQLLQTGLERIRTSDTVDVATPGALLTLCQIMIDDDGAPEALKLLDDEKLGPLHLLQKGDKLLADPKIRERTLRVALAAMVSTLPKTKASDQRAGLLERARTTMATLREEVGDSPEGKQRLVAVFFSLASGLKRQLELLDEPADRRVLSAGFDAFLRQVQEQAQDAQLLNWVADSYVNLGNGVSGDKADGDLSSSYYQQAVVTYDSLIDRAKQFELTKQQTAELQVRKALALRQAGQFEPAMKLFVSVLYADNQKLAPQLEAARTYQAWAAQPQQARRYLYAVNGAYPDKKTKKNVIWGWSRIARVTQRYKQYRDLFHEARYNMALCHYSYAMRQKTPSDREKYLNTARADIVYTQKLYPTLGGDSSRTKYDALMRRIQRALKQRETGLGKS